MKSTSAIQAKFLRSKIEAYSTMLFDEMNQKDKDYIIETVNLLPNEVMILSFYPNTEYWWVLSNFRLILNNIKKINYINLIDVSKVEVKDIFNNLTTNHDCQNIDLNLRNDDNVRIAVEENTWHVIYGILKFAIS